MIANRGHIPVLLMFSAVYTLIMFLIAPKEYSFSFCVVNFVPFVYAVFVLLKNRCKNNLVNLEFVFSIIFFYVNYAYPLFYYPVMPYFSLFNLSFPEEYINKGIALTSLAYISFVIGLLKYKILPINSEKDYICISPLIKRLDYLLLIILLLQLIPILLSGVYDGNWGEGAFTKVLVDTISFFLVFAGLSNSSSLKKYLQNNKLLVFLLFAYVGVITVIGNRGTFLRFTLLTIFFYTSYYKKVSTSVIMASMIVGMLFMNYVGAVRGGGSYESLGSQDMNPLLVMGKDLIINNRSLYTLMEYHDLYGVNWGKTFLMNILSVIPFAQRTFLFISGWSSDDISSGGLITRAFFEENPDMERIGLGTNMIGDIYIAFGLIGVILFMYYLGIFVSYSYRQAQQGNSKYLLIYTILFAESIIMARSPYLGTLRPLTWILFIAYFSKRLVAKRLT